MFGAFKPTNSLLGGLLWKNPWRMSRPQKQRLRNRLKAVDKNISELTLGLHLKTCESKGISYQEGLKMKTLFEPNNRLLQSLNDSSIFPKEHEMSPKDKYTVFNKKSPGYRKSVHKVPKWTKLSLRTNPEGF
ncbi:hypothetical protein TPHA_0G02250 [Tetrapisispora phaffii CBS 4417]|uniref:Large ribosomal subunit protein mL60 n=1 Tax=Tetrapisispora phaffii (strain ATCC 24235 / CBS 4417 / NBRC 1672 / NRRL Y-8282 / UCD 70-5) TaxID=1071381 RepID=G8BVY3_TETPH|nr:mitochondrial 54S ribosomal protein YmL31 TPHA_0G02250 [Tetrapisispora phaffii CBS 4417]CCE64061.1 hypothetical protein TPHA_0G02250 [Tetrapisispora phaffii CBS 4417]